MQQKRNAQIDQSLIEQIKIWRRYLHQHPELAYQEYKTSAYLKNILKMAGLSWTSYTDTGFVVELDQGLSGPCVGFRCDLDALPMAEQSTHAYRSNHEGMMHACGHDGHTAMLLGALLAMHRNQTIYGKRVFIFQPAEEGAAGAKAMIDAGMLKQVNLDMIFALHNWPGIAVGQAAIQSGAVMASADHFEIKITAQGGHAAMPNLCVDPLVIASQLILAIQTIISRNIAPQNACVISPTMIHGSDTENIIANQLQLQGTVRTLNAEDQDTVKTRLGQICDGFAQAFNCQIALNYQHSYPTTINDDQVTQFAEKAILSALGADAVLRDMPASMGAEDFAFFQQHVPGHYLRLGNGVQSKGLHHPQYDFNDDVIPFGLAYWLALNDVLNSA